MSFSITVYYTFKFSRLATYGNTATKLAVNEVGSTGYHFSSTSFHSGKGIVPSSSILNEHTNAYKTFKFSGLVVSSPPVGYIAVSFILLSFFPRLCPPSHLPLYFLAVTCLRLSLVLIFGVGASSYSSVPQCYTFCLCPLYYFVSLWLRLVKKW